MQRLWSSVFRGRSNQSTSKIEPPFVPLEYKDQFPHVVPSACVNGAIEHLKKERVVGCVLMFRSKDGSETVFVSGDAETSPKEIEWAHEVIQQFRDGNFVVASDEEDEEDLV